MVRTLRLFASRTAKFSSANSRADVRTTVFALR